MVLVLTPKCRARTPLSLFQTAFLIELLPGASFPLSDETRWLFSGSGVVTLLLPPER